MLEKFITIVYNTTVQVTEHWTHYCSKENIRSCCETAWIFSYRLWSPYKHLSCCCLLLSFLCFVIHKSVLNVFNRQTNKPFVWNENEMFTHGANVHGQSGCVEAKYKEMRVAWDFLHSAVIYHYKPFCLQKLKWGFGINRLLFCKLDVNSFFIIARLQRLGLFLLHL